MRFTTTWSKSFWDKFFSRGVKKGGPLSGVKKNNSPQKEKEIPMFDNEPQTRMGKAIHDGLLVVAITVGVAMCVSIGFMLVNSFSRAERIKVQCLKQCPDGWHRREYKYTKNEAGGLDSQMICYCNHRVEGK